MLQRACQQYGIDLEWRPVARPHYGAHIERLHWNLPARNSFPAGNDFFSNIQARGEYDSDGQAVMTLSEFERWLATYIVEVPPSGAFFTRHVASRQIEGRHFRNSTEPGSGLPQKLLTRTVSAWTSCLRRANSSGLRGSD